MDPIYLSVSSGQLRCTSHTIQCGSCTLFPLSGKPYRYWILNQYERFLISASFSYLLTVSPSGLMLKSEFPSSPKCTNWSRALSRTSAPNCCQNQGVPSQSEHSCTSSKTSLSPSPSLHLEPTSVVPSISHRLMGPVLVGYHGSIESLDFSSQ